jgi:hypothetical protein
MDLYFSLFDFIWEEIEAISENPLRSCGYVSYIMHMIERVTGHTFEYDKEHQSLRIKNDLKAPVEERRAAAPRVSSPHITAELLEEESSKETSSITYSKDARLDFWDVQVPTCHRCESTT